MMREEYETKMNELLSDGTTYKILNGTNHSIKLKELEAEHNSLIDDIYQMEMIDKPFRDSLKTNTTILPRIYGLPKIHKNGIPLRPIVSTINTPGSKISKYLANVLKNVSDNTKYNIKNSYEFKKFVDTVTLKHDEKLVSFDAVSLFTNVSIYNLISMIHRRWNEIKKYTTLTKFSFLKLIKFCTINCAVFVYDDKLYQQREGLQMGSSLSPIVADLVLEHLFDQSLNKFKHQPTFIKKYVDDVICSAPVNCIDDMLEVLNSYDSKLQFTSEMEINKSIPFLDMKLIRTKDNKIMTDWYSKDIASNRILNFLSSHPYSQKFNVANSLCRRILNLSDKTFHKKNKNIIRKILFTNNYPDHMIDKIIHNAKYTGDKNVNKNVDQNINMTTKQKIFTGLTYIPVLSEKLKNKIQKHTDNISIAFKPQNTMKKVYNNTKSKTSADQQSGVIYKIDCDGCNTSYIGETGRKLQKRMDEHLRDFNNAHNETNKTALLYHTIDTGHVFNYDNVQILEKETNTKKRRLLEASHIVLFSPNTCNIKSDSENLDQHYSNVISVHRSHSPTYRRNSPRNSNTHTNQ